MGIMNRLLDTVLPWRRAESHALDSDFWYRPAGSISTTGMVVQPETAMTVSAVFGCVRVLGESLAQLPWHVYKREGQDGKRKSVATEHELYRTLHDRPNGWQTPMEWKEMGMAHVCLRGNFYSRVVTTVDGDVELHPLNPDRVTPELLPSGVCRYLYRPTMGQPVTLNAHEVFHVRGLTIDGVAGVSVLEYARNAIGGAMAQETHGNSLFKNGGLPTFWIKRPAGRRWTPEAKQNFRTGWRKLHAGPENAGNPPILEDDMELRELGLTNRDSQWIESRGFQAVEICRFFRVPPHLIGILDRATFSNIEQQSIEFVTYTLGPWAIRWEQSADRDLIDDSETYYTKMEMEGLLRGDVASRYAAYNVGVQGGWLLRNEVRELEDLDPIEGGDVPMSPMNMQPAGGGPDENQQGGQPGKAKPKAPPPPPPTDDTEDDEPTPKEKQRRKTSDARAAFAILIDEAAGRIASAEIRGLEARADKAAENRPKWNLWASAFYVHHREYATKTLDPICAAWLEATGEQHPPATVVAWMYAGVSALDDDSRDIPSMLDEWKVTLATSLATRIKEKLFNEEL
jgi:HK97 family phage portal protein